MLSCFVFHFIFCITRLCSNYVFLIFRWHALINQIDTGKISFNDFERLIGKIYQENYDNMRQELITMALKGQKVDGRIKQLQQYRQVERSVQGAKDILQLATLYSLEGEFDQIRNIASVSNFIV